MSRRALSGFAFLAAVMLSLMLLSSCFTHSATLTEAEVEDEIFKLVNEERQQVGLAVLSREPDLDKLAKQYSANEFLKSVEQVSDLQYLLCNSWWVTYDSKTPKLSEETAREQVDYCLKNDNLRQAMLRSDAEATGLGVAIVGDTVYYAQAFDVLNSVCANGNPVRLYDNAQAEDPSWEQVKEFVLNDETDEQPYILGSFVCADFAAMLHNRAEVAGIRTAYVSIDFNDRPGHALNAFNTTDQGLVYIDCTGEGLTNVASGTIIDNHYTVVEYDKVAYVAVGHKYGLISLDGDSSFEYDFYDYYMQQWDDYEEKADTYEQKHDAYEAAVGGRTVISDPDEYERLQGMYEELGILRAELAAQKDILGDYSWEPLGVVTSMYVHW